MVTKDGALSSLVSLIADAAAIVEAHFKASQKPFVPSLDDTEEHPMDTQLYSPELRKAVQTIEAACAQLTATVAKPSRTIVNVSVFIHIFCYETDPCPCVVVGDGGMSRICCRPRLPQNN